MAILPVSLALPSKLSLPALSYSYLSSFSSTSDDLSRSFSSLSLRNLPDARTAKSFTVRMGGGPRTFPGGVSKWQWKRMQKKKASQLLKARLMRERQIYEMRKRAELKAAVSELERPWQVVEQVAPNLFSVGADEQVKVLADRFQKPGGFDLWTENDGPQLFETPDGLPTARFFPKGVVHSIKPYDRVHFGDDAGEIEDEIGDIGMKSEGRLKESGEWLNRSGNSRKQRRPDRSRFSESEDSDDESSHFLNSRAFSDGNRHQSGQSNIDRIGGGSQRDGYRNRKFGDRNLRGRVTKPEDDDEKSSNSSDSGVFRGANRYHSGQRNIDPKGNGSGRYGDKNMRVDPDEKSSYSSNYRLSSGVNRRQGGQKSIDGNGNGSQHNGDRNLSGRFSENEDRQRGQRLIDGKGSVGSGDTHGAINFSDSRKSASSPREQKSNSRAQIGGYNRSRRDSKLEKKRDSPVPEDVYDMSLQTDGSYSFGSRTSN